jgi:hypothetical protein
MDVLKSKTEEELLDSLLAEIAKARNEMRCAEADIKKAGGRITFLVALVNEVINRKKGSTE